MTAQMDTQKDNGHTQMDKRVDGPDTGGPDAGGPDAGDYVMTARWYALAPDPWERERGLPGHQPEPTVTHHNTLDAAERSGGQFGCLNGVCRVEVYSPDGTLQALWHKTSPVIVKRRRYVVGGRMTYDVSRVASRWQRIGAESIGLGRRDRAAIDAAMRAEMAANRSLTVAGIRARLAADHPVRGAGA